MPALRILLLLAATVVAGERPWRPGPGRFKIAVFPDLRLRSVEKRLDFRVRVTYPEGSATCPVLVYSHGMYGSMKTYAPLIRFWAAHGYACIQPTHPDSFSLGPRTPAQASLAWRTRVLQVRHVIDSLEAIGKRVPGLAGRLDPKRVAVGGHSFGAHTSQLVGGTGAYLPFTRKAKSFRDPRVRCVILISPQGRGGLFRADSFKTLTTPAIVVTGSKDKSPLDRSKAPDWRLDPFRLSPPGDKYLVWIEGATHDFGGITGVRWFGAGPHDERFVDVVRFAGLAMLDAYVRGDERAKAWLASGALAGATPATVRCEKR